MDDDEGRSQIKINNYIIYLNNLSEQGLKNDYLSVKNKKKYICKILPNHIFKEKKKYFKKMEDTLNIHKQIQHDNILKLYYFEEDNNYLYIFFKYINGKTLEKILNDNKKYKFDEIEIFIIIEQVVNVLIFFYEHKIIVKDLTLNNILIKNRKSDDEKTNIFLCNLEEKFLLSSNDKYNIETYYKKIVYKIGLIICQLLNKDFYIFFKNQNIKKFDKESEELINDYIENEIIKNGSLSNNLKIFIQNTVILKGNNIHIKNLKKEKWFFNSNEKMDLNNKNKESIINESFSSNISKMQDKSTDTIKKNNYVEETIYTDEAYLELYKKEKELKLGIIDYFDKDEILRNINESKNYREYNKIYEEELEYESETTQRTKDENKESIIGEEKRRRKEKSRRSKTSIWKCSS